MNQKKCVHALEKDPLCRYGVTVCAIICKEFGVEWDVAELSSSKTY